MTSVALFAPSLLQMRPDEPLAGAELSVLHLRTSLQRLGHTVTCFTNRDENAKDTTLRSLGDFREKDFEVVVYSRTYGHQLGTRAAARRILWLHDTVEEAASLIVGGIEALGHALGQYHHLVFVSAWHRMHYAARFPHVTDWQSNASSIRHLLPEVSLGPLVPSGFDVIHTAHPRKALAAVLGIYDLLAAKRGSLRLALVDAAGIYQQNGFMYEGRQTSLSAVLRRRYAKAPPPFTVLAAMPQHGLIPLLSQCAVFLHPDESTETGATTLLEAVLAGCTTVVSDLGCLPEMAHATGSMLPRPGKAPLQVYADAVCLALDRRTACLRTDINHNICKHNHEQTARWAHALSAAICKVPNPQRVAGGPVYRDINGLLAAHHRRQILDLTLKGSENCKIAVHLFPQRDLAFMGLLEPVQLPMMQGDIDLLASAFAKSMNALVERLRERGITRLVMRIASQPASPDVLAACLCAASVHGACMTTIGQLTISLTRNEDDDQRERRTLSPRVRQQITAARTHWIIRRLSKDPAEFEAWFNAYDQHRSRFSVVGLARKRVLELLDSEGELGVHGALAIDPVSGQASGFYLILRTGEFAALHSWGTNQRYRSNLHKLLIADAIRLARQKNVTRFEYGSDLSEHGQHGGLNTLYRRFAGHFSPSIQLDMPVPWREPPYTPI